MFTSIHGVIASSLSFGGPWSPSTSTYDNISADVSNEAASPYGLSFSSDGTKMYIADFTTNAVYQYTLSPAWDIDGAVYASKSADVDPEVFQLFDVEFSTDGTKMYVLDLLVEDVFQYTLSTAWDVSTALYASKTVSLTAEDITAGGIEFNDDGTKMYMVGQNNDTVYQYTLSPAWDVSTALYASKSVDVSNEDTVPYGVFFKPDGKKMFLVGNAPADAIPFFRYIYEYTLGTAWDVSTATYDNKRKDVYPEVDANASSVFFKPDGTKMYIGSTTTDAIYQYTML